MLLVTTALWLFVWGGNLCQRGLSFHAFPPSFPTTSSRGLARLSMKWTFTKGTASAKDLGLVGDDGELYFHPTKQATIDLPADMPLYSSYVPKKDIVSKVYDIPVFPVTNLIGPGSKEWMNVYEMKYRHLISTVMERDGKFALSVYSQSAQKIALVGTLVRVNECKYLEDGQMMVLVEGLSRLFVKQITSDRPFIIAKVQNFHDYSLATSEQLDMLERKVFRLAKVNMQLLKVLYPNKNYTFSDAILETQPVAQVSGFRSFNSNTRRQEMKRRSDFSFAMIEMLEATYSKKISLLQELQLDNRLRRIYGILFDGSNFLKDLLLKKNIMSQQQIDEVLRSVDNVPMDLSLRDTIAANTVTNNTKESESMARAWMPENYINGKWTTFPVSMS